MPDGIEVAAVRLPGRETRLAETAFDDLGELAQAAVDALAPALDVPFALFGHCSGALAAFEVARNLRRRGLSLPTRLIVASYAAPSLSSGRSSQQPQDLRERLRDLGGTDPAVLENDELFELLRPAIEADFRFIDDYSYVVEAPFDFPISIIVGTEDAALWKESLTPWQAETTHELDLHRLPGDHFFGGGAWDRLGRAVGDAALESFPSKGDRALAAD